jgi:hypothetical protein
MPPDSVAALLAASPCERTKSLISMFWSTTSALRKDWLLFLLYHLGDLDMTAELYAQILESDARPGHKLIASTWGQLGRFKGHRILRGPLEMHLQGELPDAVWFRTAFPNGPTCSLKRKPRMTSKPRLPAAVPAKLKGSAKVLHLSRPTTRRDPG